MSNQLLNEKIALFRLNSAPLQKLVIDLDEQTQEFLSGGAKLTKLRPLGKQLVHPEDSVL